MSNLFQPPPPPPGNPTPPGYLPPQPPQRMFVPPQRGSAPPRQRPVLRSYPPAVQPPAPERLTRRSGWRLVIAGMVVALLIGAGVVVAVNKVKLGAHAPASVTSQVVQVATPE